MGDLTERGIVCPMLGLCEVWLAVVGLQQRRVESFAIEFCSVISPASKSAVSLLDCLPACLPALVLNNNNNNNNTAYCWRPHLHSKHTTSLTSASSGDQPLRRAHTIAFYNRAEPEGQQRRSSELFNFFPTLPRSHTQHPPKTHTLSNCQ